MKLNKWMQVILIGSSIVTLAACSTHKKPDHSAVMAANESYGANASGIGHESSFGDRNGTRRLASNGRVYYFDYDSNVVRDADKASVAANATHLVSNPQTKVTVEGHTDPRGSREYNIGLGERRAKAISEILTNKGGSPNQVRVVSYGAEKLAAAGHTEGDYQQDRRAVIVYKR